MEFKVFGSVNGAWCFRDERVLTADDLESGDSNLIFHERWSKFVLLRLLLSRHQTMGWKAIVDDDKSATGSQGLQDVPEHRGGLLKMVVRIKDEDGVHPA